MIPLYHVDAFTTELFHGNPAAVCLLDEWLPDATLASIARENQCPETAFVLNREDPLPLRWFSPKTEVPLCGHATLATGFTLLMLEPTRTRVDFTTASGALSVERAGRHYALDLPALPLGTPMHETIARPLCEALRLDALGLFYENPRHRVCVLANEDAVLGISPDFTKLTAEDTRDVIVTAPGRTHDFVSRYFAPAFGIPEDPVTGSAHGLLIPYWSRRLGRPRLRARQCSERGGELTGEVRGDRVWLEADCRLYLRGELMLGSEAP
ncbi:MAG: PhzF family phenazine biosynthesis protein [Gammaproteobacteria bacterium]